MSTLISKTVAKEIVVNVNLIANQKGIDKQDIYTAIETALVAAILKKHGGDLDVLVKFDPEEGMLEASRRWTIVEEVTNPDRELTLEQAAQKQPEKKFRLGDIVEEPIENIESRIAAQTVGQIILQKVREAERANIAKAFLDKVGQLVTGVVKRVTREGATIDLGENAEAFLAREDMFPREAFRVGDKVRSYLYAVRPEARGPQMLVSRTSSEMLIALFKLEVPEIAEEIIEVKGAARDPGSRAKIAVKTNDKRIDPIGACIGMRGTRVQAVANELADERIDIVLWDDNPAQFVINAMAPAEVASIVVDEDKHIMDIAVEENQLSQAIGRNGQNVRLASILTGWTLNVMTSAEAEQKQQTEAANLQKSFVEQLGVDEEIAAILVHEGFTSIEEVAYIPLQELLAIEDFDEDVVNELRKRAQDALLMKAIAAEQQIVAAPPAEDLLTMEGMTKQMANLLASHGIVTREDLADQSVDDLLEIKGVDKEAAAKLIMTARAPWFADNE